MKNIMHRLFPLMLAIVWITTSGYVLSRLASLQGTVEQQHIAHLG